MDPRRLDWIPFSFLSLFLKAELGFTKRHFQSYLFVCVCVLVCVVHMWRLEDNMCVCAHVCRVVNMWKLEDNMCVLIFIE